MTTDPKASENELVEAVVQCLPYLPNLYFVLDGIDECSDCDNLVKKLLSWTDSTHLKVIIFSRPDVASLRRYTPKTGRIQLDHTILYSDMTVYVEEVFEEILEEGLLPETADKQMIVRKIVDRAEGMFLWVRLMANYLKSPAMTRSQRLKTIMEPVNPGLDRLDDMYSRIHARINSLDEYSIALAHRALLWTAYASPSSPMLCEALFPEGWDVDTAGSTEKFDHAIIVCCCGLVEKGYGAVFRYIHLSALQYAQNGSQTQSGLAPLLPDTSTSDAILGHGCISYLHRNIPNKPLSGQLGLMVHATVLERKYPLLRYATLMWIHHVVGAFHTKTTSSNSSQIADMAQVTSEYLESKLQMMAWVEALYTFASAGDIAALSGLSTTIADMLEKPQSDECKLPTQDIQELIKDLSLLNHDWGLALSTNPAEIWGDVTLFTRSRFFQTTKAATLESLVSELEYEGEQGVHKVVEPTFSAALSSSDANRLAILNIFPPK